MGGRTGDFTFPILVTESREGWTQRYISILPVLRTLRQEDCLEVEASLHYMQNLILTNQREGGRERREKRKGEKYNIFRGSNLFLKPKSFNPVHCLLPVLRNSDFEHFLYLGSFVGKDLKQAFSMIHNPTGEFCPLIPTSEGCLWQSS